MLVLCTVTFYLSLTTSVTVQAPGKIIDDNKEIWKVDFSWYIEKRKKAGVDYTEFNDNVKQIDSNACLML